MIPTNMKFKECLQKLKLSPKIIHHKLFLKSDTEKFYLKIFSGPPGPTDWYLQDVWSIEKCKISKFGENYHIFNILFSVLKTSG